MPSPARADHCVTVRLPTGVAAELKAATGMPISQLLRLMAMEVLKRERAKRVQSGKGGDVRREFQEATPDVTDLPQQ